MTSSPPADIGQDAAIRIRQQEVVAELGQQALETDDLDQLLHDAVVEVAETLAVEHGKVLELVPDGNEPVLELRTGVGWADGLVGEATVPTDYDSQAGYTLLSEEPIIVNDLRTEGRFTGPDLLVDHGVVSGISVIIGSITDPWGVLGVHATEKREFTEHDANFVTSVANVLGTAIENKTTRDRLQTVHQRITSGVLALNKDWEFTHVNQQAAEILGYDRETLLGANIWEIFPTVEETTFEDRYREAMARQKPVSFEAYYPPFETWFQEHLYPSETGLSVYFRDITEEKERERELNDTIQELRESEERLRLALQAGDMGTWELNLQTEDSPVRSPQHDKIFGYDEPLDDWSLETFLEHVHPDDRDEVERRFQRAFETGTWELECRIMRADGEQRVIAAQGEFYYDDDGEPLRAVGIVQDVTEQTRRKRQLEESNRRLEQFAYAASHDLQEPLRMVTSYLQLLERQYGDVFDEDGEEFLEFAIDGAERMREMIDGLLEYSRVDTQGKPLEPIDLNTLVEDVQQDLRRQIDEHDAEITVDELPRVNGDSGQLRQVFQNLFSNAIMYSGDEPPRIHVDAERQGRWWLLSVRDEGIGIDADDQDRVFEVFQRLHSREEQPGTGIGLALCRRIIERHDGRIWLDSEPGAGTTFSFTLPPAKTDSN